MRVKFITMKGASNIARAPFYLGIPQHERTMSRRETAAKTVAVKAGAGPVVPEPTITGAKTRGESEGSVNIAGGILDVVGANLETATAVELHSDTQPTGEASLWQTMPATYADGKLTTGELDFDEKPSDGGFVRVATAGGSALYPITYCAH